MKRTVYIFSLLILILMIALNSRSVFAITPTVTFSTNLSSIYSGQSSTLTWSSTNATGCTKVGGAPVSGGTWTGATTTTGSINTGPLSSSQIYQMYCSGAGGKSATSTININVLSNPLSLTTTGSIDMDSKLRIKETNGVVAIAGSTTLSASKLHLATSSTQILSILYVSTSSPFASNTHIKLADGSIMAMKLYSPITNVFAYNSQDGLYNQTIFIKNTSGSDVPGVRLTLESANANLTSVWYKNGTDSNGNPYIEYNQTLKAGDSLIFNVVAFSSTRAIPVATYSVSPITPNPEPSLPSGSTQITLNRTFTENVSFLPVYNVVEFPTPVTSTKFTIEYSDDGSTWHTIYGVSGSIWQATSTANVTQWIDYMTPISIHTTNYLKRTYRAYKLL